jgi:hypothetical protein
MIAPALLTPRVPPLPLACVEPALFSVALRLCRLLVGGLLAHALGKLLRQPAPLCRCTNVVLACGRRAVALAAAVRAGLCVNSMMSLARRACVTAGIFAAGAVAAGAIAVGVVTGASLVAGANVGLAAAAVQVVIPVAVAAAALVAVAGSVRRCGGAPVAWLDSVGEAVLGDRAGPPVAGSGGTGTAGSGRPRGLARARARRRGDKAGGSRQRLHRRAGQGLRKRSRGV